MTAPPPPEGVVEWPAPLARFIRELEDWTALNLRDARRDTLRYWILKLPAVLSAASAGVLTLADLSLISAILAAVASTCVLIDAVNPGGQLRNAHLRAAHDLRQLQHSMLNRWRVGILRSEQPVTLAAEMIESAQSQWQRIAGDLRAAETAFGIVPAK